MFVGLDPARTRQLGQTMRAVGQGGEDLRTDVEQALQVAELTSNAPGRLTIEATDLDQVGLVLIARADLAEGFDIDVEQLAESLNITKDQAAAAVAAIQDPGGDPDANPLLATVNDTRSLFAIQPSSIRDNSDRLPEPGADPEVDAAVARFDAEILPRLQNGESIDSAGLSAQQQKDLQVITIALGGDDVFYRTVTTREKYSGGRGDDEYRTVTRNLTIADANPAVMLGFVRTSLASGGVQVAAISPDDLVDGGGSGGGTGDGGGGFNFDQQDGKNRPYSGSVDDDVRQVLALDSSYSVLSTYEGNGQYSITVGDPNSTNRGTVYSGTYSLTDGGYEVDVDIADPDGRTGSITMDVDADGFDVTQNLPDGTVSESTGFPDGSTAKTVTNPDGSVLTTITSADGKSTSIDYEVPDDQKVSDDDPDRFNKRGDDADQNGFPDFGDPRDTVNPDRPGDTGGNGLL